VNEEQVCSWSATSLNPDLSVDQVSPLDFQYPGHNCTLGRASDNRFVMPFRASKFAQMGFVILVGEASHYPTTRPTTRDLSVEVIDPPDLKRVASLSQAVSTYQASREDVAAVSLTRPGDKARVLVSKR